MPNEQKKKVNIIIEFISYGEEEERGQFHYFSLFLNRNRRMNYTLKSTIKRDAIKRVGGQCASDLHLHFIVNNIVQYYNNTLRAYLVFYNIWYGFCDCFSTFDTGFNSPIKIPQIQIRF